MFEVFRALAMFSNTQSPWARRRSSICLLASSAMRSWGNHVHFSISSAKELEMQEEKCMPDGDMGCWKVQSRHSRDSAMKECREWRLPRGGVMKLTLVGDVKVGSKQVEKRAFWRGSSLFKAQRGSEKAWCIGWKTSKYGWSINDSQGMVRPGHQETCVLREECASVLTAMRTHQRTLIHQRVKGSYTKKATGVAAWRAMGRDSRG